MKQTNAPKSGRNTTAITNPKTKSQNTTANTKSAGKAAQSSPLNAAKSGFGRNTAAPYKQSKSLVKSVSAGSKSGTGKSASAGKSSTAGKSMSASDKSSNSSKSSSADKSSNSSKSMGAGKSSSSSKSMSAGKSSSANKSMSAGKSSNQSSNKMEVSSEFCKLKDFDIASDVLGGQKALLKLYGTALCESDCPNLRNIINTQLSEVAVDQFDTFTYMNQRGMYPTEQAPAGKVKQAVTQFNKKAVFKSKQK